jgi:hypothetical protein
MRRTTPARKNETMSTKNENTPSQKTIKEGETITLETRFGGCSRGKCWGKFFPGKTRPTGDFEWVEKSNGNLLRGRLQWRLLPQGADRICTHGGRSCGLISARKNNMTTQITIEPRALGGMVAAENAEMELTAIGCKLDPSRDRLWIVPAGKIRAARQIARTNNYPTAFAMEATWYEHQNQTERIPKG